MPAEDHSRPEGHHPGGDGGGELGGGLPVHHQPRQPVVGPTLALLRPPLLPLLVRRVEPHAGHVDEAGGLLGRVDDGVGQGSVGPDPAVVDQVLEALVPAVERVEDVLTTAVDDSHGAGG